MLNFGPNSRYESTVGEGKQYYGMEGTKIWMPDQPDFQPKRENLEYHFASIFKA
jgi:hypothetical protein